MLITLRQSSARFLLGATLLAVCGLAILPAQAASGQLHAAKISTLDGKLVTLPGRGPMLKTQGKDVPLASEATFILHTLEDPRLANREVRLEGTMKPDGRFEVTHFFTVKDGKLYRVRYYCEICNIAALEPGRCVCCQRPTELQEIPVSQTDKDTLAE